MALSSQPPPRAHLFTMNFQVLAVVALVAAAQVAADYHDDTFHFSTLGSVSGLQKSAFVASPAKYSSQAFIAAPAAPKALHHHHHSHHHVAAAIAAPVYAQYAAPAPAVFAQQYSALPSFAAAPAAAYAPAGPQIRILSQVQESDPAGPYKLSYATENGIQVSEQGALVNSAEGPAVAAQGSYSYTGADGQAYSVSYIADENGFRAAGDHLPTPPPIPAEILKSLEENAASGERYDEEGRLLRK